MKKVLEREVLVKKHGISLTCLEELKKYLPWLNEAITAYYVFTYT